jgi:hypothetical protein
MKRIVITAAFLTWLVPAWVEAEFLRVRQTIFGMD